MKLGRCGLLLLITIMTVERLLFAHGGGLDSSGGHHDRKNGGYHYHRAPPREDPVELPKTAPVTLQPAAAAYNDRSRTGYRSTARTTARTEPTQSYRTAASNDYSSQPHLPPTSAEPKIQLEAHFRVWLVNGTTKDIVSYTEHDDRYMLMLTYGGSIGFPKTVVTKIEPLPATIPAASS